MCTCNVEREREGERGREREREREREKDINALHMQYMNVHKVNIYIYRKNWKTIPDASCLSWSHYSAGVSAVLTIHGQSQC